MTTPITTAVGGIGSAGAVYESALYISGPGSWLSTGLGANLPNPTISGDATRAQSTFNWGSLSFSLTQELSDSVDAAGDRVGSALTQRYDITNTASVPNSVALTRYLDGDLDFDGTIDDGGGQIYLGGNRILFETDAASGGAASTTFVGITNNGGVENPAGAFEVSPYSGLRDLIGSGGNLGEFIENDTDGDGFIDSPYDVTMALSNYLEFDANETITFTTQTLFGNAVPPAPGSSETLPLLPGNDEPPFVFDIDPPAPNEIVWFDPIVAVGYDYEMDTATSTNLFSSVAMPTLATVPQIGQYELFFFDGLNWILEAMLDPGELFNFALPVDLFRIANIDPGVGLDPNDPLAFPTGIGFFDTTSATFSMTPLTTNTDGSGYAPAPGVLPLIGLGWIGLIAVRRRFQS